MNARTEVKTSYRTELRTLERLNWLVFWGNVLEFTLRSGSLLLNLLG